MDTEDVVLSDVHLNFTNHGQHPTDITDTKQSVVVVSRFLFAHNATVEEADTVEVDSDGDMLLPRRHGNNDVINIEHTLQTTLKDVGMQVWQGCLLLCDYIIDANKAFDSVCALELGGGVGLASICLAMYAHTVICTDYADEILQICKGNVLSNQHLFKVPNSTRVRRLNLFSWQNDLTNHSQDGTSEFDWTKEDLDDLKEVNVIISSDVIYDNDVTDALFTTLSTLMRKPRAKTLYLAVEKRLNFTLEDLEVACPAYEHFRSSMQRFCSSVDTTAAIYTASQIDTTFPQHFVYDRSKHLELWTISANLT